MGLVMVGSSELPFPAVDRRAVVPAKPARQARFADSPVGGN
jgi:hypothetical protein